MLRCVGRAAVATRAGRGTRSFLCCALSHMTPAHGHSDACSTATSAGACSQQTRQPHHCGSSASGCTCAVATPRDSVRSFTSAPAASAPDFDTGYSVEPVPIRCGHHILEEVGDEARDLGMKRVALFTDRNVRQLEMFERVTRSLRQAGIDYAVYDGVDIEPTDRTFEEATRFAKEARVDSFLSLGGGSVMDTCKAANLFSTHPHLGFFDVANVPVGRALPPPSRLRTHIACPTTCGTGSECTGFAVCDVLSMKAKTGIGHKYLKPDLAVIDLTATHTLPAAVIAASGFDVLSHAVESFTARPYTQRVRQPTARHRRPLHQGRNPYSDIGCEAAMRLSAAYLRRAVRDPADREAREQLMFAAMLAGTAMGNAGTHLPHGMSYPVSGLVQHYRPAAGSGYPTAQPLIPHGMSVILNAPAAFRWTAEAAPDRHLQAAALLGADTRGVDPSDSGALLRQTLIGYMQATGMPNGLRAVGFSPADIPALVRGALPQQRVLGNAPRPVTAEALAQLYADAMRYWDES